MRPDRRTREERLIDALVHAQVEPGDTFAAALAWCLRHLEHHNLTDAEVVIAYQRCHR